MNRSAATPFRQAVGTLRNALATLGLLVAVIMLTPVTQWWTDWLTGNRWDSAVGDTLLVLGGSNPVGKVVGYSSYWRSVYAAQAWKDGKFRRVIVSGSDGTAESMAAFLRASGVPTEAIAVEPLARTTEENARYTAPLLRDGKAGRIVLMTSDFHMRRSRAIFERAGFRDLIIAPVPDAGKRATRWLLRWEVCLDLATETAKLALYEGKKRF